MKILSLHIDDFAGICNREIKFEEGLNIIEGDNESGKTTIWLFIKFMLYGMPRRNSEERIRSVSRDTHTAKGSMTVLFQNEQYRIFRTFSDTGRDHCSIYRMRGGAEFFAGRQPGEVFLGVPREIYESSCGVGQMQCHHMSDKKGLEAIRNLLSSADESVDVSKVVQRLDRVRVQYRHKTGKGGKLYDLSEQIELERAAKDRALLNARRKLALEERLTNLDREWEKNEEDAEQIRVRLVQMSRVMTVRRFDRLKENEEQYRTLLRQKDAIQAESLRTDLCPTQIDVASLRVQAEQLSAAEARLASTEESRRRVLDEESICEENADVGERLESAGGLSLLSQRILGLKRNQKTGGLCGVIGLIAAAIFGVIGVCTVMAIALAALIPLALSVAGWITFARSGKALGAISAEYGKAPAELLSYLSECANAWRRKREQMERILRAESERDAAANAVQAHREALHGVMLRTLPEEEIRNISAVSAIAEAERLDRFLQRTAALERQINAMQIHLNEEREALEQYDEDALRAQIPEELFESKDEDFRRFEQRQAFCAERRRALDDARARIQIELANLNAGARSPMEIADRERTLVQQAERAERYYHALIKAIDALQAAAEEMSGTVTPRLERDAGEMMSYISDGAYTELQTGNEFSPSLWNDTGRPVPTEMMSGGTRDAAYLSLRIALMMQIFERELPPLILDESLCTLDDRRMGRMLAFLGKLSETRLQCLLFTCHKREAAACEAAKIPFCRIDLNEAGDIACVK